MKTSWRRLLSSSSEDSSRQTYSLYLYVSRRRLDQDQYIRIGHTSSRRLQEVLEKRLQDIFKAFSRRLQDIFKTSSKRLRDVLQKRLQDVFKTSSRHLQDAFETFWRRLQDIFNTSCKDVFKALSERIILLCSSFQDIFKTYSQRFWGVLQRRLSTEGLALVTLQRNWQQFLKF